MASSVFRNRPQNAGNAGGVAPGYGAPGYNVQQGMGQGSQQGSAGFQPPANLGQIKGLWNMMKSGGNVSSMAKQMIQNNPQGKSIMEALNRNGGDAKAAFYDMAKQKGVDPNVILNMLK